MGYDELRRIEESTWAEHNDMYACPRCEKVKRRKEFVGNEGMRLGSELERPNNEMCRRCAKEQAVSRIGGFDIGFGDEEQGEVWDFSRLEAGVGRFR